MGFVTPALLGGILLVGLPVVLHLIMRREAKPFVFPALRFVQLRRSVNQHRLRLRHLLLLALRCAIIVLLALALARPTLRGGTTSGTKNSPIAAVLVFDTSLRMQYEHRNQTRLEQAQEMAAWLLEQLPAEGPLAVVEQGSRHRGQELDRAAAELRVARLQTSPVVRPMEEVLRDATDWLREQTGYRGEVYVFTDMARVVWSDDVLADFAAQLDELGDVNVYLIDVGVEQPSDLGLDTLRLSGQQLTPGSLLQLQTELHAVGALSGRGEVLVELYVGEATGQPLKRGQQAIEPASGEPAEVEFPLAGLELGTHQGYLRIAGSDPLPCDDIRYFTVDVRPPRKVLLLGEEPADYLFVREALAPTSAAGLLGSKFECEVGTFDQIGVKSLTDFDVVCAVDPPPLPSATWQTLTDFVHSGGGLGIFLGRHARREDMNDSPGQLLLPGKLRWQSQDETYLRPVAMDHPALGDLKGLADSVPWSEFPVFKYWELEDVPADVRVVAWYANGRPALLERQVGSGRVLVMTTSVSDPAYNDPWNLLPTGPDPWPFLALVNGLVDYLGGISGTQLNYLAGQTAVLQLSPQEQVGSFVLQLPGGDAVRQSLTPGRRDLTVASTDALGNYRVRAGGQQGSLDRGFSVNCPAEMSDLARVDPADVAEVLVGDRQDPPWRVRTARTRKEIEVRVGLGRVGRELFPMLILTVAAVLGAELLLSNRFYEL